MELELAGRNQELAVQAVPRKSCKLIYVGWLTLIGLFGVLAPLCAQTTNRLPAPLQGVGIDEKVGQNIDLNLEFTNEKGYQEPLKDFFKPGRPVLLDLVYYNCPMLCNLLLNGQVDVLRKIPFTPGDQYEVVTVTINPSETFDLAKAKKQTYLAGLNKPEGAAHWHFLTDYANNSEKLAAQVGFKYKWDPRLQNFAHTAAIMFLSPTGKVCRYLYGIKFKPLDVRLAFTEASQNKYSFSVDRLLLFCYHYDPKAGSYTAVAANTMTMAGGLTVLLMGFGLWRLFRADKKKRQSEGEQVLLARKH
jgi:protein SCO1